MEVAHTDAGSKPLIVAVVGAAVDADPRRLGVKLTRRHPVAETAHNFGCNSGAVDCVELGAIGRVAAQLLISGSDLVK